MSSNTSSDSLQGWNDLREEVLCKGEPVFKNRPSLLIGNGFSINIWSDFKYTSLYEKAEARFIQEHKKLFDRLETNNFEVVLSKLAEEKATRQASNQDLISLEKSEQVIRNALIQAIRDVHIPSTNFYTISNIVSDELINYNSIYYTNYDLLIYWSVMYDTDVSRPQGTSRSTIFDFFWNNPFNPRCTNIYNPEERSGIYYLHGGLHLYEKIFRKSGEISDSRELLPQQTPANLSHQDFSGTQVSSDGGSQSFRRETYKRINDGTNILDLFDNYSLDEIPLFISEGGYLDKLRSIHQSDYLKFLFECFKNDTKPLVILGHSLADNDKHIADAIIKGDKNRYVAISINTSRNSNNSNINEKINRFKQVLQGMKNLHFFDAATHPLLVDDLQVG